MCPPPCGPRRGSFGRPRVYKVFPYSWLNDKRVERDGIVYSVDGKTIVKVDRKLQGELKIKAGVERILKEAFCDCRLTKIILPETIKKVGPRAFADSWLLESVSIPATANVDATAFRGCYLLKTK